MDIDGVRLPTARELAALPFRVQVALAARSVRRVRPAIAEMFPSALKAHVGAVSEAEIMLDRMAQVSVPQAEREMGALALRQAADALRSASHVRRKEITPEHSDPRECGPSTAEDVVDVLHRVASIFPKSARAIQHDYELAATLVKDGQWTDETPMNPDLLGPLWSSTSGESDSDIEVQPVLQLHISIPSEIDRKEADRIIEQVLLAANRLHHAYGGSGLTLLDKPRVYEPALIPVGGDA